MSMKAMIAALALLGAAATAAYAQTPPAGPMPHHERPKVDLNGDGKISWDEFEQAAMKRFDRQDIDHDGRLTKAEWTAAPHRRNRVDGDASAGGANAAPTAAPGAEGEGRRHGMGGMMRHKMQGMMRGMAFDRTDANDDGVVTRDEAERAAKRMFAFLDLNGDGVLSGKELPAHGMGAPPAMQK
jgi:hypothetical protein